MTFNVFFFRWIRSLNVIMVQFVLSSKPDDIIFWYMSTSKFIGLFMLIIDDEPVLVVNRQKASYTLDWWLKILLFLVALKGDNFLIALTTMIHILPNF